MKNVGKLALAIQDVDGDEDDAHLHGSDVQIDELQTICQIHAQAVATLQTSRGECVRHAIRASIELAESVLRTAPLQRYCIAAAYEGQVEELT